eukprot:scaffold4645_cov135-Amphora_coffeaeformis.AAC.1
MPANTTKHANTIPTIVPPDKEEDEGLVWSVIIRSAEVEGIAVGACEEISEGEGGAPAGALPPPVGGGDGWSVSTILGYGETDGDGESSELGCNDTVGAKLGWEEMYRVGTGVGDGVSNGPAFASSDSLSDPPAATTMAITMTTTTKTTQQGRRMVQ